MKYDFDAVVNRKNTNSYKWDTTENGVLPMWVADMDFKVAPQITDAIILRALHGVFGYTMIPEAYYQAEISWWQKRHNFQIQKEWIEPTVGVIPSLSAIVQAFCDAGDKVLIQSPVYNYFYTSITNNKCEVITNNLLYDGRSYSIDFEDFEEKLKDEKVKLFILCNPHNPVGRVWKQEELQKIGQLCIDNGVIIVSDEIHRDLVYSDAHYTPIASINEDFLYHSITCTAPSKTFNIAGLKTSNIIIANDEYRQKVNRSLNINEAIEPNVFGIEALIQAYSNSSDWLDELLVYLEKNRDFALAFIQENLPTLKAIKPEGTYLLWIDCSSLHVKTKELVEILQKVGKLRIADGSDYGVGGENFIRINLACPLELLKDGLARLKYTIKTL